MSLTVETNKRNFLDAEVHRVFNCQEKRFYPLPLFDQPPTRIGNNEMKIKDHIKYWLDGAEHDWDAAKSLFSSGKYDWCLFIGHLVLEKTLKALFIQDNNNQLPPKTHNLVKLARHTNINMTEEQEIFLDEVNDFNLEARYPQYKSEF